MHERLSAWGSILLAPQPWGPDPCSCEQVLLLQGYASRAQAPKGSQGYPSEACAEGFNLSTKDSSFLGAEVCMNQWRYWLFVSGRVQACVLLWFLDARSCAFVETPKNPAHSVATLS